MQDLSSPQGLSPRPLQWKHPALTPGPPRMSLSRDAFSGACQRQLTKAPDHPCPLPSSPCPWTLGPCPGARGHHTSLPFLGALGESRQAYASWFRAFCGCEGEQAHPEGLSRHRHQPCPSRKDRVAGVPKPSHLIRAPALQTLLRVDPSPPLPPLPRRKVEPRGEHPPQSPLNMSPVSFLRAAAVLPDLRVPCPALPPPP